MTTKQCLTFAAAALAASVSLANAQTAQDHSEHHPAAKGSAQVVPLAKPTGPGGMAAGQGMTDGKSMPDGKCMTGSPGMATGQGMMGGKGMPVGQGMTAGKGMPDGQGMMAGKGMPDGRGMMGGKDTVAAGPGMMGGKQTAAAGPGMMGGNMAQMMAMMHGMPMMQNGMPMGMGSRSAGEFRHIEGQLAFFKTELHITDAQLLQWNAFADALRGHAAQLAQVTGQPNQSAGPVSAPDQFERGITLLSARLDTMRATLEAAKPLYAVLTDDQKKIADGLVAEHMVAMRVRGL